MHAESDSFSSALRHGLPAARVRITDPNTFSFAVAQSLAQSHPEPDHSADHTPDHTPDHSPDDDTAADSDPEPHAFTDTTAEAVRARGLPVLDPDTSDPHGSAACHLHDV
jgi:hypothetical protein